VSAPDRREFLARAAGGAAALALVPELFAAPPRAAEPVALALVGAGRQGRAILGELATLEAARVAAVCDTDESRLASGLRRVQGARGYASHAQLLEKEKDLAGVVVATPTHLHRAVALDVLSAGKAVFCEAPLAASPEDARAIAKAARESGRIFQCGYQARSNPIYALARSFVRSGTLQELALLRAQTNKKTSWRTPSSSPEREAELNWHLDPELSSGLMGELGSHQLDVVHWFLGRYPIGARGGGAIRLYDDGRKMPDTAWCDLDFGDGVHLSWSATLASSFEGRYELLEGSMATIKLAWTAGWMFKEADAPTQGWEVYANRQQFHNDEGITLIADATKLAAQGKLKEGLGLPHTPLYYALEDFVRSIAEAKPPACSADEGLRTTLVALAAQRAIATGAEVAIDPSELQQD
jgi:predicted dehydrogenase